MLTTGNGDGFRRLMQMLALMMVLALTYITGCEDDEGFRCSNGAVDPRLTGEWMSCDEAGSFGSRGMQILADGTTFTLGVDWRDGSVAVSEESCSPFVLGCADGDRITWPQIPGDYDTLRFTVEGDRLDLTSTGSVKSVQHFRRVSLGQVITAPVACGFSGMLGTDPWTAPHVYPNVPVFAVFESLRPSLTLFISGTRRFSAYLPGFHGTGSYVLGRDVQNGVAGIGHPCSDVGMDIATRDDSLSTIVITLADTLTGRVAGSIDLMLHDGRGNAWHATGNFDGVLRTW